MDWNLKQALKHGNFESWNRLVWWIRKISSVKFRPNKKAHSMSVPKHSERLFEAERTGRGTAAAEKAFFLTLEVRRIRGREIWRPGKLKFICREMRCDEQDEEWKKASKMSLLKRLKRFPGTGIPLTLFPRERVVRLESFSFRKKKTISIRGIPGSSSPAVQQFFLLLPTFLCFGFSEKSARFKGGRKGFSLSSQRSLSRGGSEKPLSSLPSRSRRGD